MQNNSSYETSILMNFLQEDIGAGDLSVVSLPNPIVSGYFVAKSNGILAGQFLPSTIYQLLSDKVEYTPLLTDGTRLNSGDVFGKVSGPAHTLLTAERLILNLMQRMSGIATATSHAIDTLNDSSIGILDTRKTAPGLRYFDKIAVHTGGGINHRMGLYDSVMIKDNHWKLINDLPTTVRQIRTEIGPTKTIEVEVETLAELQLAVESRVDIIMFDNQTPATVSEWKQSVPDSIKIEVSGGITLDNLATYAHCGANFISLGYLTNHVIPLDLSFELD